MVCVNAFLPGELALLVLQLKRCAMCRQQGARRCQLPCRLCASQKKKKNETFQDTRRRNRKLVCYSPSRSLTQALEVLNRSECFHDNGWIGCLQYTVVIRTSLKRIRYHFRTAGPVDLKI
ncbi:hypothetical protein EV702DRAFT_779400 [Suillus placidus]|uniref:Uncharacterized protein n=1 Tax=Suillus placidus TaxID=48579 RepID=A0A9P7A0X4_9AGAM|nr:hypothetical protein EV702DRAFT_779400 [Suillus placidus]